MSIKATQNKESNVIRNLIWIKKVKKTKIYDLMFLADRLRY